ncbi:hypothetical protein [Actinocrispum sp. NPDC049592]|uniref:hypothetical protein n=1 Tax=Actinocrispum sp. NPDC049592 TaxID=3154835 RepID=UPI00342E8724
MSPRELGGLVVTPGQGADISTVRMHTSGGCPNEADAYYAVMKGKGFPADGQIITANTDVGLSHTAGFDVYLGQTLGDFAADNNTKLQGKYEITVQCIDSFSQNSFGQFSASLEFGSPTKYVAVGAAKGPDRLPDPPRQTIAEQPPPVAAPPPTGMSTVASQQQVAAPVQPAASTGSLWPILVLAGFSIALVAVLVTAAVLRRKNKSGGQKDA